MAFRTEEPPLPEQKSIRKRKLVAQNSKPHKCADVEINAPILEHKV